MKSSRAFRALFIAAAAVFFGVPRLGAQADNDTCFACHGQEGGEAPFVDEKAFRKSIHGNNLCVSCHADAEEIPHPEKLAAVSCARCHRVESQIYLNSDHGRAVARGRVEAAGCKDCHGHSHTLLGSRNPESPVHRKNLVKTCAQCHADEKRMADVKLTERHPLESYNHTVHGEAFSRGALNAAICSDCHGTHDLHGSFNPQSRIHKSNIPNTCGKCHQNVQTVFNESIHGWAAREGIKEAPVCTDCHGEHTIRSPKDPSSPASVGAITKTCAGCHESEKIIMKFGLPSDRLQSYMDTYHGLAAKRGDMHVANCASCHGFHDILPSSDPRSSIHKQNLANTCGRCHPGAGPKLTTGYVHAPPEGEHKHWILGAARKFYLILIPLVLGFMLLHNLLDWFRKSWEGVTPAAVEETADVRLTAGERWQHLILIITFVALAWTGFALKFHDSGWMQWLNPYEESTRRLLHRWAAGLFTALGIYHLLYMALTARGRFLLKEFWPRWADARHLAESMAYNAGLRKTPPAPHNAFYHYAEKIEYWALLWGSVVMVVTGLVLVFNNMVLKHMPLWISDLATLIHYFEAILACLAILIWHFYGVIFDPKVYPMNWAWIFGRAKRKKK